MRLLYEYNLVTNTNSILYNGIDIPRKTSPPVAIAAAVPLVALEDEKYDHADDHDQKHRDDADQGSFRE